MRIRRLEAHEVDLHRRLRLAALREAPDSFGETLEDVSARPSSYWDSLTRSVTEAGRHAMFLACDGETVLGCAYGLVDADRADGARVGGMWVDPAWRGRGVGGALLDAVAGWARAQGRARLGLWAPAHSPAAIALYHRGGFRETGQRKPLPANAGLDVVEMVCESGRPSTPTTLAVREANLADAADGLALVEIIDSYARGPGGQGRPLSARARAGMVPGLREHPCAFALLAFVGARAAGAAVCVWGFSTFAGQPYVNVHDLAVLPGFQGQGVGTRLLDEVERRARARGCCKVTLEVHDTNHGAKRLYERVGFGPWNPPTLFVSKPLEAP